MSETVKALTLDELKKDQTAAGREIAAILSRLENKYGLEARLDIDRVYLNNGVRAVTVSVAVEIRGK